jgi:hypothetical protein
VSTTTSSAPVGFIEPNVGWRRRVVRLLLLLVRSSRLGLVDFNIIRRLVRLILEIDNSRLALF